MNEIFQQLAMALIALAKALEQASGPKSVVRDGHGNIVGIEPVN